MNSPIIRSTEDIRREKLEQEISNQHASAVRNATELRKLVLFDSSTAKKSEIDDFAKGTVDQRVILALRARDEYLNAEDSNSRLGFFRMAVSLISESDERTLGVLKLAMEQQHHREKLAAQERRDGLSEPTDAEIEEAMKGKE